MPDTHLFPGIQKPGFDTEHFHHLLVKRNRLDYECYLFLYAILEELPERHYQEADELLIKRNRACGELLNYLATGEQL